MLSQLSKKYLPLIKSPQTALLLVTGVSGFLSADAPLSSAVLLALVLSLFLAISGSTVLNMWYDHDIDARMDRTCLRPLPAGLISRAETLRLGTVLTMLGLGLAFITAPLFGAVILTGVLCDVVIYTIWLKRRSAWSIVWGGISGGMPVLAGRVLATGNIDHIGILLTLAVLFWIPTHIMTFNMRYLADYKAARIPTFPSVYGLGITRLAIALSSILAAASITAAAYYTGVTAGYLHLMAVLSGGLLLLAAMSNLRPSERGNFALFKYASLFMLAVMVIIAL